MDLPRVGAEISGYRLERVVARGGMSVVFEADHLRLGRKVAFKILASDLTEDDTFRERFVRESRIAAGLDHPNIIPIYEAGESDGLLFIAMRFVRGPHVKELIRQVGPLPPRRLVSILGQVGSALDAAHSQGLVHRDVKPGNILVDLEVGAEHLDHVYLCDFGVTKQKGSHSGLTRTGQFVGTIDYISPEQVDGKEVDARTDIYSLGCMLYECLTGTVPFPMQSEAAVLWAHMQEDAAPATSLRGDLPRAIDGVVARAMAKRPDDRFQSCEDLVAATRAAFGSARSAADQGVSVPSRAEADPTTSIGDREPEISDEVRIPSDQRSPYRRSAAEAAPSVALAEPEDELDASEPRADRAGAVPPRGISGRGRLALLGLALLLAGGAAGWGLSSLIDDRSAAAGADAATRLGGDIYTTILEPHIPREIAPTCHSNPSHARPPGLETAHFVYSIAACSPAEVEHVDYFFVHSTESMQHAFLESLHLHAIAPSAAVRNRLDRPGVTRGLFVPAAAIGNTCGDLEPAANLWITPIGASDQAHEEIAGATEALAGQIVHGMVACYEDPTTSKYYMVWTENQTNVLSVAYDSNDRNLYHWWTTKAGPTIEGHYTGGMAAGMSGATGVHG